MALDIDNVETLIKLGAGNYLTEKREYGALTLYKKMCEYLDDTRTTYHLESNIDENNAKLWWVNLVSDKQDNVDAIDILIREKDDPVEAVFSAWSAVLIKDNFNHEHVSEGDK